MGVFSKIKRTVNGIAKNPTNLRNYADLGLQSVTAGQVDTRGINGSAVGAKDMSFDDLLLGKKSKDINPDEIANQIRATQSKGIGELNAALDSSNGSDVVTQQAELAKKGVLTSAQDARRNAQRLMAQSGLKNSSLGLSSARSIDMDTGDKIANINAAIPGQIRNQQIQDASTRIGLGGLNQNGINFNTVEGQRSGGVLGYASALAPMAGSIGQIMSGKAALERENRLAGGAKKSTPTYSGDTWSGR